MPSSKLPISQVKLMSPTAVPIAIFGHSLTTYAVAAALSKLGYGCTLIYNSQTIKSAGPSLVLNDVGVTLLRELFGELDLPQFSQGLTYRWVRWGQSQEVEPVYQPAWVIPTTVLLTQIKQSEIIQSLTVIDETQITAQELDDNYAWTIYGHQPPAGNPISESGELLPGGQRVIITAEVTNDGLIFSDSCYIESLLDGWLFYAPLKHNSGVVQACLPTLPTNPRRALLNCLYYSNLISPLVNHLSGVRCFPSAPRLQLPLFGSRWLRVGQAAIKLDPISGEGTPFALRTGILAAAVTDGILQHTTTATALLNHYQTRLTHSFLSHLQGCSQYYQLAFGNRQLWQSEIKQMINTSQILLNRFNQRTNSQLDYQLIGLKLHDLSQSLPSQIGELKQ